MKLGEALTIRARQAQSMADLTSRIKASSVAQEGDQPAESVQDLIVAYLAVSGEHAELVKSIIQTNVATVVDDGVTILDLLQGREMLIRERNIYAASVKSATSEGERFRYTRNEIKTVPQIDIQEFRQHETELNATLTAVDLEIQKINWETELLA